MPNATTLVIPNKPIFVIPNQVRNLAVDYPYPATNNTRTGRSRMSPTPFSSFWGKDGGIQGFLQGIRVNGMLAKDEGEP
jgi:hypothetical protein